MTFEIALRYIRNISASCAIIIALLLLGSYAYAHSMKPMGKIQGAPGWAFLHGMDRTKPNLPVVNCCLLGGNGDCQLFPEEGVSIVPGGYRLKDGEFIPEAETTVSPDENYYRCQHPGAISHCFFAPPQGF